MVIDVDSHFWEPFTWLKDTDPRLWAELDGGLPQTGFADIVFGEVLAELPERDRAEFAELLPIGRFVTGDDGRKLTPEEMEARVVDSPIAAMIRQPGHAGGADRVAACDAQGIDVQWVNPTTALGDLQRVRRFMPERLGELCHAYNTWASGALHGLTDRLVPVALIDFADTDRAVAELTRMREAGARAYLIPLYPVNGRALSHPDFDRIWDATEDLGLVPTLHVAAGSVVFDPGWTNSGRPERAVSAFRLASSQNAQIPQLPLADLVLNGVFDRHPGLRVLCAEFGLSWVPGWLDKLGPADRNGTPNISMLLPWTLPRGAHDYVVEHVMFSPLRGQRVDHLLEEVPGAKVVFASDYPHPEGSSTAVADFEAQLAETDPAVRADFFGGTVASLLAA